MAKVFVVFDAKPLLASKVTSATRPAHSTLSPKRANEIATAIKRDGGDPHLVCVVVTDPTDVSATEAKL